MAQFVTNHKQPYEALTKIIAASPLSGKKAFVTGAGRGVGLHIVRGLATAGVSKIGLLGRDETRINKARDDLAKVFPHIIFTAFAADITDEKAIEDVFEKLGAADILVNNAGIFPDDGPFIEQDLKSWWYGFSTNVLGTAVVTQKYLRLQDLPKSPVVLNVSSIAAHMRFPLTAWTGYNASKLAQLRMFEYLRFEFPHVRFISAHPGSIESDGFTRSNSSVPEGGMTNGEMAGQFFAWLATDEAAFLSGRFVWAEWDVEELKKKKDEIFDRDLLLTTIEGFSSGIF